MKLEKKYSIVKSSEPNEEGTHIILLESKSEHGYNCGRVFKGTYAECKEKIKEFRGRQCEN